MRNALTIAAAAGLIIALSACDLEQTEEGELPEVEVQEGSMPEYDVDPADVDVGTEERTVEVPTVDIGEVETEREVVE